MRLPIPRPLFGALLSLIAATVPLIAQNTGTLTGRISDSSGAMIPGVEVTLSSPAMIGGSRGAVSDEQGVYRFTLLPAGTYQARFQLPGFSSLTIQDIRLGLGTTQTVNATMSVAALSESVTVSSDVPAIDLEAAAIAANWDQKLLETIPSGRSIRALVAQIPGLYQNSYDVGGSGMGTLGSFRTYGRGGGDFTMFDGIPQGSTQINFGAFQEVQFVGAAKGAEAPTPGAYLSIAQKTGGNELHGGFYADWQDDSFQSSNVNDGLRKRGFTPGSNKFTRYNDFNGDLGGRIVRDKLWYYGSFRDTYSGLLIPGFVEIATGKPAIFYTKLQNYVVKMTYQINSSHKIDLMGSLSRKHQARRGGSEFVPLESTQNQDSQNLTGPKLGWTWIVSPKTTVEVIGSRWGWWWPSLPNGEGPRRTDQTSRQVRGSWLREYTRPIRWQWSGTFSHFADIGGSNHEIKSGFQGWRFKDFSETSGYPNQQEYFYRSQAGDANLFLRYDYVLVYNYPIRTINGDTWQSWYLNDRWKVNKKLTLNLGIRYDFHQNWHPQQGNPGTGPFATKSVIPAREFKPFHNWAPRLSFVYDVTGNGKLALKASYGRYYNDPGVSLASASNPSQTTTYRYNNWNGSIPYVPRPQDLVSVTGGRDSNVIEPIKNAFTDEYTAGVDYGLSRDYTIRFNFVRKRDKQGRQSVNIAQPFSAFTAANTQPDPGRDNVTGTSDDRVLTLWAVPRTYPGFNQSVMRLMNVPGAGNNLYSAVEATFNKQYSNGWSLLASFTTDFRKARNTIPQNPTDLAYDPSAPVWDRTFKVVGAYDLPKGFVYATTYNAQSGEPFGRQVQVRNALNSTVTLTVEPFVGYYPWVKLWDNRISKTFRVHENHEIDGMFDWFNVLNSSAVLTQDNRNGTAYLRPTSIIAPRIFRLGIRWKF